MRHHVRVPAVCPEVRSVRCTCSFNAPRHVVKLATCFIYTGSGAQSLLQYLMNLWSKRNGVEFIVQHSNTHEKRKLLSNGNVCMQKVRLLLGWCRFGVQAAQ